MNGTMIQTVLGPIAPDALGITLMHEHLLYDITPPSLRGKPEFAEPITLANRYDIDYGRRPNATKSRMLDREMAVAEVAAFHRDGGAAIVELSIGGLSPDPDGLAEVSRRTGVHVVMGCGQYLEPFQAPENADRSVEDFASEMMHAVRRGAFGTGIRAGLIGEIGCSEAWTDTEKRVMAGAVLAQRETGAALTIHPGAVPDAPFEIIAFLRAHDADLSRTIMDHLDRTLFDDARLFRLADTGCVLEFDLFGVEHAWWAFAPIHMPNDRTRLETIRRLIARGHLDQIAISQDICRLTRLHAYGGHGYGHILRNIVPLMREIGFAEEEVRRILVETPRRLLSIKGR
jgi:phosphotriesterase-related protein